MGVIELGPAGSIPVESSPAIEIPANTPAPGQLVGTEGGIQVNDPIDIPDKIPADGVILLDSPTYPKDATYKYLIELLDVTKIRGDNNLLVFESTTGFYNHKDINDLPILFPVTSVFGRTGDIVAVSGDYNTSLVPEGSNLYYTEARVTANPSVVLNSAKISADGSIDTHSDVDTSTTPPVLDYVLSWDGFNWIPALAGGATIIYDNVTPMPEKVGGYEVGTQFFNQNYQEMWDGLLYPYQYPAFTSFTISGQATTLECGIDIPAGFETFLWTTDNPSNVNVSSIIVRDLTNAVDLGTALGNTGSASLDILGPIGHTTTASLHQWRITGTNSKTQDFDRTFTVRWYNPFYYGVGAVGLTPTQVQALTKQIVAKSNKTYPFAPTAQVQYFAYPVSYGALTSILDGNNFETLPDWTQRTESFLNNSPDFEGVTTSYYVYEFVNITSLAQSYQFIF